MRIAIHAADLDQDRIDGTRVYLFNMLKNFGKISKENDFLIYHQSQFNPHLTPPAFSNYKIKQIYFPRFWTQIRFALQLLIDKPDVLWMPVHNVPMIRRKKMKVVVTIHDVAFKVFPSYFPKRELKKLNRLTDYAINNADRIIAISECTKKDILKFYPQISEEKISVIHHGFDAQLFQANGFPVESQVLEKYGLKVGEYLLYVGAIQPRKDLEVLVEAFEKIKADNSNLKLIFAGAPAWQYEKTLAKIKNSHFRQDIIVTGTLPFEQIKSLFKAAGIFVFPSLYEGFGIPLLEAFASGVPVIAADNSSLLEVGGEAATFFKTGDSDDLAQKIKKIQADDLMRHELIKRGLERARQFSWLKCAEQTIDKITIW